MAQPSTRQELIDYCKRKLGAPVLEINSGIFCLELEICFIVGTRAEYVFLYNLIHK